MGEPNHYLVHCTSLTTADSYPEGSSSACPIPIRPSSRPTARPPDPLTHCCFRQSPCLLLVLSKKRHSYDGTFHRIKRKLATYLHSDFKGAATKLLQETPWRGVQESGHVDATKLGGHHSISRPIIWIARFFTHFVWLAFSLNYPKPHLLTKLSCNEILSRQEARRRNTRTCGFGGRRYVLRGGGPSCLSVCLSSPLRCCDAIYRRRSCSFAPAQQQITD